MSMTRALRGVGLGVLLSLALVRPAGAQEPRSEGISLGSYIMGPKLTADSLKGRVILLELWGIN
jgi:hypothetical protein